MTELADLYQEVILDHNRNPRNRGPMPDADREAIGNNPLCGDRITVRVKVENGSVRDVKFEGQGCAISTASASLMTQAVIGKPISEVRRLFERFRQAMANDPLALEDVSSGQPELKALGGVWEFPIRVKCATLPWHTLDAALRGEAETSTEEE